MSEYNRESEHAAIRRKLKQRDQTARENAALAAARGEDIERLKAQLAVNAARLETQKETVRILVDERDKIELERDKLREEVAEIRDQMKQRYLKRRTNDGH